MDQIWEEVLYITGGKLELPKCFFVPITWKWQRGRLSLHKKISRAKDLQLKESETKESILIPRLKPQEAEKRLGIYFAVEGKWSREFHNIMQYTKTFVTKVSREKLDRISG